MTDYLVPVILVLVCALALGKKESAYDIMLHGAKDGLKLLVSLVPTLILLMTGITMLRSSGATELLSQFLAPALKWVGIPPETALLVIIRPISGSAALAVGTELMTRYGVDSQIGRTVAVMLGSTETTFYAISVYCAAAGIKRTRYILPASLLADLTGFITAAFLCR